MPRYKRGNRSTAKNIETQEKTLKILELRKAGLTWDRIAEKLGYSERGAPYKLWKKAIETATRESATEALELELQRLDDMFLGFWAKARTGHGPSADRALRIMERRASLLGLNSAQKVELSGTLGELLALGCSEDSEEPDPKVGE